MEISTHRMRLSDDEDALNTHRGVPPWRLFRAHAIKKFDLIYIKFFFLIDA